MAKTTRTREQIEDEFQLKWEAGMLLWEKRKTKIVMELARSFFAKIKLNLIGKALKKIRTSTKLSPYESMTLARSTEYIGYSLTEDFPVFDKFLTIEDLYPFFEVHSDRAKLDELIAKAKSTAKQPKILDKDPPFPVNVEEEQRAFEESQIQLKNLLNINKIGSRTNKDKFKGIKT